MFSFPHLKFSLAGMEQKSATKGGTLPLNSVGSISGTVLTASFLFHSDLSRISQISKLAHNQIFLTMFSATVGLGHELTCQNILCVMRQRRRLDSS